MKCVAGGTYNPNAGDAQHTTGDVVPFEFYFDTNKGIYISLVLCFYICFLLLNTIKGTHELDNREFTWVKCNKDFKGYYITNYDDEIFKAFTKALENKPDVRLKQLFFFIIKYG